NRPTFDNVDSVALMHSAKHVCRDVIDILQLLDYAITLTGCLFQAFSIRDPYCATGVLVPTQSCTSGVILLPAHLRDRGRGELWYQRAPDGRRQSSADCPQPLGARAALPYRG